MYERIYTVSDEIDQHIWDRLRGGWRQLEFEETCSLRFKWTPERWQKHVDNLASALHAFGDPLDNFPIDPKLYDVLTGRVSRHKDDVLTQIEKLRTLGKLPLPQSGQPARLNESTHPPQPHTPSAEERALTDFQFRRTTLHSFLHEAEQGFDRHVTRSLWSLLAYVFKSSNDQICMRNAFIVNYINNKIESAQPPIPGLPLQRSQGWGLALNYGKGPGG